ncbi:hypothetical protein [Rugosimonospora africana]|nr:hypothetical protein [Rugosimonospora africana]
MTTAVSAALLTAGAAPALAAEPAAVHPAASGGGCQPYSEGLQVCISWKTGVGLSADFYVTKWNPIASGWKGSLNIVVCPSGHTACDGPPANRTYSITSPTTHYGSITSSPGGHGTAYSVVSLYNASGGYVNAYKSPVETY